MSVATEPRPHAPYAEPDEYIDYQLRKTQTSIKRIDMLTAAVIAVTVLIGYVLLFVLSDHWLFDGGVGGTLRVLMFLPVIGFVGWLIGAKVIWPALKNVSGLFAAKTLEASSTDFRSNLLSLIDLRRANRPVAPAILATMEKRVAVTLTKLNIDDAIDKRPLLRTLSVLFGIVVAFCLYSVLSPKKLGPSVLRAIIPFTNVAPATQTEIVRVEVRETLRVTKTGLENTGWEDAPEKLTLRAGAVLEVRVSLRDEFAGEVTLLMTTADRRFVDQPKPLLPSTDSQLKAQVSTDSQPRVFDGRLDDEGQGLLQSFTYRIVAGDARSPEYRVEIITPPSATVTEVRYQYPEYMELDARTQSGGAIDVWEQTSVTIKAATNVPIQRCEFELDDSEDFASSYAGPSSPRIEEGGKKLTIAWRANPRERDGKFPKFYRVKVWDAEGNPDPKPAVYPINVRLDLPPQVVLIDPTTDLELPANGTVPLVVAARDQDFKLRSVSLKIAREGNDVTDESLFDSEHQGAQQEVALKHDFSLEPLRLKAGDKIKFWIEAQDNRLPTHNLAKTEPLEITIKDKVSKDEAKQQLAEQKQQQQQKLDQAQENNTDASNDRPQQEPTNDNKSPDQQTKDPMPRDADNQPNPDDPKQDQPKSQPNKSQQENKSDKSQNSGSGKPQNSGDKSQSKSGQSGNSSDQQSGKKDEASPDGKPGKQSLKNDGTDDDKALEKIAQRQNKNRSQGDQEKQPSQQEAGDESTGEKQTGEKQTGEKQTGEKQTGEKQTGEKQTGEKQTGEKQTGEKQTGEKQTGEKQTGEKQTGEKQTGEKQTGEKQTGEKQTGEKQTGEKQTGEKQTGEKQTGEKQTGEKQTGEKQTGEKQTGEKQTGEKQTGEKQTGEKQTGEKQTGEKQTGEKQTGEKQTGEKQTGEKQTGEKQTGEKQTGEKQTGEKQTGEKQTGEKQTGEKQTGEKQTGEKQTGEKQTGEKQTGEKQTGEKQTGEKQTGEKQTGEKQTGEKQTGEKQTGEKQTGEKQTGEKQTGEKQTGEKQTGEKQTGEKQTGEKQTGEKQTGEKQTGEKQTGEKQTGEKQTGEKQTGEKQTGEKQTGEKQTGEKEGGEKEGGEKEGGEKEGGEKQGGKKKSRGAKSDSKGGKGTSGTGSGSPNAGSSSSGEGRPTDKDAVPPRDGDGQRSEGTSSDGSPEEANPEFTKQAANLVLKRLKNELDRGEVDQELLDELGWTPEQMKKFVDRMQQQVEDKGNDNSPAAQARRRQFEEMLRNLDVTSKTQRRNDTSKDKQSGEAIGPVRRAPPAEYREWFESYKKSVSKKQAAEKK